MPSVMNLIRVSRPTRFSYLTYKGLGLRAWGLGLGVEAMNLICVSRPTRFSYLT
jgi:hypothetical protein